MSHSKMQVALGAWLGLGHCDEPEYRPLSRAQPQGCEVNWSDLWVAEASGGRALFWGPVHLQQLAGESIDKHFIDFIQK